MQLPKANQLAGSVEYIGDWDAGKAALRGMVSESLAKTAEEINEVTEGKA